MEMKDVVHFQHSSWQTRNNTKIFTHQLFMRYNTIVDKCFDSYCAISNLFKYINPLLRNCDYTHNINNNNNNNNNSNNWKRDNYSAMIIIHPCFLSPNISTKGEKKYRKIK